MKTVHDALLDLRELLNIPERWCQYAPAVDERGTPVTSGDPHACQWCLVGGTTRVCFGQWQFSNRLVQHEVQSVLQEQSNRLFGEVQGALSQSIKDTFPSWSYSSVELFNDAPERTYADILRVLDQAVAFTA